MVANGRVVSGSPILRVYSTPCSLLTRQLQMTPLLDTALEAALAAGAVLKRKWRQARDIRVKGPRDIVTDADLAAQRTIASIVQARYPEHVFLGEEGGARVDLHGPPPTWVVDPLDGTTNYSRHLPAFSVAVAVAQAGSLLVGVIHDPIRAETFYAERGQGAFVRRGRAHPEPLRVSTRAEMEEALVGVDWAHDPSVRRQVLAALASVADECRSVRALGSAALGLAYVAAGRLDAYYHLSLQPWDVAAGALLIAEAGGAVSLPNGQPWQLGQPRITASNGLLQAAFLRTLDIRD